MAEIIGKSIPMGEERDPQTYEIIGAAMEVHSQLGNGFLEAVYQEAFVKELKLHQIPYIREVDMEINYKGEPLTTKYRADFVCFGDIIVELKATSILTPADEAQLINYLKATGIHRGLLLTSVLHHFSIGGKSSDTLTLPSSEN